MKTRSDIKQLMNQIFEECQKTREASQLEYAHKDNNAFANFERLAIDLGISRETVLWIYVKKHLDGILAYINGHKSQREDVRGRIKDVIVYLILLWGMVDDNNDKLDNLADEISAAKEYEKMNMLTNYRHPGIGDLRDAVSKIVSAKKSKFYTASGEATLGGDGICKNCGSTFKQHNLVDERYPELRECPT